MRNRITIDQGNSSSKVCVFSDNTLIATYRFDVLMIEELLGIIEQYNVESVIYCSVARLDIRLIESLRNSLNGDLIVLTHETPLPIELCYSTPKTLGFDRIAAAVGANARYEESEILVVDAGTALTIDVVADNKFMGGNISPGISLRFKSLNSYTTRLPLVNHFDKKPLFFGNDTQSAILSGVVNGVVAEILSSYQIAKEIFQCKKIVITGGDANYINSCIPKEQSTIIVDENLVAYGLNRILHYNEDI